MLPVLILLAIAVAAGIWLWLHRERRGRLWGWAWLVPLIALGALAWVVSNDLAVQKVIGLLLMPAGFCWLALIAMVLVALLARHWWSAALAGAILLLYTASGSIWLGSALLASLEREVLPGPDLATTEAFEAIFVFGGGTDLAPDGSPCLGDSGDRVVKAAHWYLAGKTPVLVTGGRTLDGERSLGEEVRALWRGLGVADQAILIEPDPLITRTEVERYHALAAQRGWKRVAVLSSAWHLPRVLSHCRRLNWSVIAIPSDARSRPYPFEFRWFVPQSKGFARVETASWELLGRWVRR